MLTAEIASPFLAGWRAGIHPDLAVFATTKPFPSLPLYTVAGLGAASLIVGLCLLAEGWLRRIGVLGLLVPARRQSLTLYVAHILVAVALFESLASSGQPTSGQVAAAAALSCAAASLFALIWALGFRHGLLESVMRSLTGPRGHGV